MGLVEDKNHRFSEFVKFFYFLSKFKLNEKEIKYLIWRFCCKKKDKEIIKLESRKMSRQAINLVIRNAYKKIKLNIAFKKSYCIL